MDSISLQHFHCFHVLARTGSYARAAEELNLSQPALSRSIQTLERQVGARLIDRERGRRGISLTAAGREALARTDAILTQVTALSAVAGADSPSLVFGIGPQFATYLLPSVLHKLSVSAPQLAVEVVIGSGPSMLEQLLDGTLEFFISGQLPAARPRRVECLDFTSTSMCYSVRAGHPLLSLPTVGLDDIARYPRYAGSTFRDRVLAEDDATLARLRPTVILDNFEVLAQLTANTDGVLVSFDRLIRPPLVKLDVDVQALLGRSRTFCFTLAGISLSEHARTALALLRAPLGVGSPA